MRVRRTPWTIRLGSFAAVSNCVLAVGVPAVGAVGWHGARVTVVRSAPAAVLALQLPQMGPVCTAAMRAPAVARAFGARRAPHIQLDDASVR